MRVVLACLALLVACAPPSPPTRTEVSAPSGATAGQLEEFQLPTGNIGCAYVPPGGTAVYQTVDGRAELQCDRVAPTYVRLLMSETGAAVLQENLGEAPCCSGPTLAYGEVWSRGPFRCIASEAGLTCSNGDGHRFMLNRERAEANPPAP